MKKVSFIATGLVLCASVLFASNFQTKPAAQKPKPTVQKPKTVAPKTQKIVEQYTCSMHPDVITDKPGKCPKCGMALVKKVDKKTTPGKKM